MKYAVLLTLVLNFSGFASQTAQGVKLVSNDTIKKQKELTHSFTLKNGIPVIYREIEKSDIIQLEYSFDYGLKDEEYKHKMAPGVLFDTMVTSAKNWPKSRIFETTEKYAANVDCSSTIETSSCRLSTVDIYWNELLPMFAAIVKEPQLTDSDIKLIKDRKSAELHSSMEDPGSYANEVVNRVFYPPTHPYRLGIEDSIKQLASIDRKQLLALHKKASNASLHQIVIVGAMSRKKLEADLNHQFGSIKAEKHQKPVISQPGFSKSSTYSFEHRKIPTAYIRIKMNADGVRASDAVATKLLFKILDEELGEEVRTRQSLSYSVFSFVLDYQVGIGVMGASTSKPKETLTAINEVVTRLKNRTYTDDELEEQKTVYATNYFLTQEEHSTLAAAISNIFYYFGKVDPLYDMPRELNKVTPLDIKRLANKYLANFRMGVVYDRDKFNDEWAKQFIDSNLI